MSSDEEAGLGTLLEAGDFRRIVQVLINLERGRGVVSMSALSNEPRTTLETHPELTVEINLSVPDGCQVYGCYRPNPPTIVVHPSVTRRDNFTLLHEYGHHVQRQHDAWVDLWLTLPDDEGRRVNEEVADQFAAEVLMPEHEVSFGPTQLSARAIRDAYGTRPVSRMALARRAVDLASPDERATVAVIDRHGTVTFARSTYEEIIPMRRGAPQPDLARLFEEATRRGGRASGLLTEGLRTASGWSRQGLTAEVATEADGMYGFVVVRREGPYGALGWARAEHHCPNEACGEVFVVDESVTRCQRCHDPKCPHCGTCSCDEVFGEVCAKCYTVLTPAERTGHVEHECY